MKVPLTEMENSGEGSWILLFWEGQGEDFYFEPIAFKQVSVRRISLEFGEKVQANTINLEVISFYILFWLLLLHNKVPHHLAA